MKLGILFPLSGAHPGIGSDFMDGLNALLSKKQLSGTVTILKESVGFGGFEKEVYTKAEKLLVSDDVDVLIAYIDLKVTGMLHTLVQATGKLVIIVNPGANYPENWLARSSIIHLNLQHAFLCHLTGTLAAAGTAAGGAYVSSFYDCGYLHAAAMVKQFAASGGSIRYNFIFNQNHYDNFSISELTAYLDRDPECGNLLCIYDELPASLFYKLLNEYPPRHQLKLFVSPMMLQPKALGDIPKGFHYSIDGYLPWYPGLANEANQDLMKACKRPVTIFSLLGWESALVVAELVEQFTGDLQNGDAMVSYLAGIALNGPRGALKLDAETQFYIAPAGRYNLKAGETLPAIEWVTNLEKEWKDFTSLKTEGAVTGWMNTYLCY